jgi:hypothetical protein
VLEITLDQFRVMFPRLSNDEAVRLHPAVTGMKIEEVLDSLAASCDCFAGSLFCLCGSGKQPSKEALAVLAPLIETWARGVPTSSAE